MKPTCIALFLLILMSTFIAPSAARAADPRCADTLISAPASHSTQSGVMFIAGRAQMEGAFVRYQVDFSTTGLNLWVLINSAPQAVMDGTLARWDTTLVPEGSYDLRVRTVDTTGNYCESLVSSVFVKRVTADSGPRTTTSAAPALPTASVISINSLNGTLTVDVPQVPYIAYCTPSYLLGSIVTRSVRLCAGQVYRPFTIMGNDISIVEDATHTATIQAAGRTYGITVLGGNVLISGVHITGATAAADMGNWLCLYEQCLYKNPPIAGGANYGGGILLEGSNNTVMNSQVSGGVVGIATLNGHGNKLLSNQLTALSGWGIFGVGADNSAFVGNTLQDINRACADPSGVFYSGGCESAGMLLMGADTNIIANNVCARSGNCYYLNGEGGRLNNFNKLYGNYCAAPSFNCFEITDARGIEFDNNTATLSPEDTAGCEIWLVRAQILSGRNNRVPQCNHRNSHLDSTYDPPK
jgi:Right handed beta helix region